MVNLETELRFVTPVPGKIDLNSADCVTEKGDQVIWRNKRGAMKKDEEKLMKEKEEKLMKEKEEKEKKEKEEIVTKSGS